MSAVAVGVTMSATRTSGKENVVTDDKAGPSNGRLAQISLDWWATIVAGVVVLLAVAGLLPKIPW